MKDIIRISWDSGYYALIPEKFFPTTMEKTRKVFKLMLTDPAWGDAEIKELLQYFQERRDRAVKSAAENRAMSKATMELSQRVLLQYPSESQAGREVGLNSSNIAACCSGKRMTAGGFRWRWVNE